MEDGSAAELELSPGEKSPLEKTVSQSSIIRRKSTRGSSFAVSEGTKEDKTEEVLIFANEAVAEKKSQTFRKSHSHPGHHHGPRVQKLCFVYLLCLAVRFLNSRWVLHSDDNVNVYYTSCFLDSAVSFITVQFRS